jgi:RNA polymerase sigma-70 factor, ECF subfamily
VNRSRDSAHLYGMVSAMQVGVGDLVRAAVAGDDAAFTELVARHHRDVLRVAYVICRDPQLAEDAAQSAWAKAWTRLGDVRDPDLVRGWLVAVTANEARRVMRSRRHGVREISVSDLEGAGRDAPPTSDPGPHRIALADLAHVLGALDPADRALIALRFVGELSSEEIGAALGMSASGARGRLSRLLIRLRGELRDG